MGAFFLSLLPAVGQWVLKIFLGGLFNKVVTQEDDEAQHKLDASVIVAQSQADAAKTEIQIIKDQAAAKEKMDNLPPPPVTDPFNNTDWNSKP